LYFAVAAILVALPSAAAQQDAPKDEKALKAQIMDSECWRRAMFELDQWYRTQVIFTPEEVARQRAAFQKRVEQMSATELKDIVDDLDLKFRILDSPEVQDVRDWFGHFISILADRRREELLREIPDFATMTPAELNREIMRFRRKMNSQASFDRTRQARVDAQKRANRNNQPAPRRAASSNYRSPYRPRSFERPFDNVQTGTRRSMTIAPEGQIWMNLAF